MVETGRLNELKVVKEVSFGCYLDGGAAGEILLPGRYVPKGCRVNDKIEVFIYHDSEDRIIATTERPYVMVGEFACLKVISETRNGAFLDWGLPKDLLVPFAEQKPKMAEGKRYVVRVYVDEDSGRIVASARLNDFLYDESEGEFEPGEEVALFVANKTELGYKMIINNSHWGLLHYHEVVQPLGRGKKIKGFIREIRDDGKIDLALYKGGRGRTDAAVEIILKKLQRVGGHIDVTDSSSPEEIRSLFGLSKGAYKKAVGSLYKRKLVLLGDDGIYLVGKPGA